MRKMFLLTLAILGFAWTGQAAQHDYVLDNQPGAAFRADLNGVLSAIVTNNSSATAPATTYANMWWYDTSTGLLKRRDNANTAWIIMGLEAADTDGTLAANSDAKVPTQKAAKTYIDARTGTPSTAGYSLQSAGAGVAPVYSQVDLSGTEVTGILSVANGGTGSASGIAPAFSSIFLSGFSGNGIDGDAVFSSNADISGQVKQYNNLTINSGVTLTANLALIAVKGTLTINGTISANGGGFAGGASRSTDGVGNAGTGYTGTSSNVFGGGGGGGGNVASTMVGGAGGKSNGAGGAGGTCCGHVAGYDGTASTNTLQTKITFFDYMSSFLGGGGGGGGRYLGGTSGAGGNGGGAIYIECGSFVGNSGSVISANGSNGGNGSGNYNGGGGGGGGGSVIVRAKTITTNAGSITATGGSGGSYSGNPADAGNGASGGSGATIIVNY